MVSFDKKFYFGGLTYSTKFTSIKFYIENC